MDNSIVKKWNDLSDRYTSFSPLMTTGLLLVFIIILFTSIKPQFLSVFNLGVILNQCTAYIILAVAMTFIITTGGIDISVGSQIALTGVITGHALVIWNFPIWVCLLIAIFVGMILGAFNGFFIAKLEVPPIIVTLGTFTLYRGLAYVILEHRTLFRFPQNFLWISRGRIIPLVPMALVAAIIVVVIGYFLFNETKFGRHVTAVGGNLEASRLSGINVVKTKFFSYVIMGLASGIATITLLSRLGAAQASLAYGYEFHTIAAVVLGGTAIMGGKGLLLGSFLGALVLGFVENGLVVIGLGYETQRLVLGLTFIIIVVFRTLQEKEQ